MKNTISYYYKVFPSELFSCDNGVYFYISDYKFYFLKFDRDVSEITHLVSISNKLYSKNVGVHTFIETIDKNYYVETDEGNFVLLRVNSNVENLVNIYDVINFNKKLNSNEFQVSVKPWSDVWITKLEEFEGELMDLNKEFPILRSVSDYYLGMCENAISYVNDVFETEKEVVINIQHNRVFSGMDFEYLYNPLNFTFDYETRDLAHYISNSFFEGSLDMSEIHDLINKEGFSKCSLSLLFGRLLYPSYFFEIGEDIMSEKVLDMDMNKIINKANDYEKMLSEIYFLIKGKCDIPYVEWLVMK